MGAEETVKVTIKLRKSDHSKLMSRVEEAGTTISDYIRPIIIGDIYNRNTDMNLMEQICRVSTLCTQILEEGNEIPKEKKNRLLQEAKKLCQK